MKFSCNRTVARCKRRTPAAKWGHALLAALLLGTPATVAAGNPEPCHTPARDNPAVAPASPSPSVDLVVFQVYNTATLRVHFAQRAATPVTLRLENERGTVLYREIVRGSVYVRKFDLSDLPDARYYVVLQAGGERQVKEVLIRTQATRSLTVR